MLRTDIQMIGPTESKQMRSAVKIAIEVTGEQACLLDSQSKMTNWLYNHLLETANGLRQQYRQSQDKQVGKNALH